MRSGRYAYDFTFRGVTASLPLDVAKILSARTEGGPLLSIDVGGVILSCHFFTEEEIEFDLDPRAVTGQSKAEAVFDFMRALALSLDLPVRMTPENMRANRIFEFNPGAGKFSYYPSHERAT